MDSSYQKDEAHLGTCFKGKILEAKINTFEIQNAHLGTCSNGQNGSILGQDSILWK